MSILALVTGILLIVLAMVDALWTTLTIGGGGPLTSRIGQGLWRGFLALHSAARSRLHRQLVFLGTVILMVILLVWVLLLWSGWTLLFSAQTNAVVDSHSGAPADLSGRIYFTGYTLFTLGIGNYVPRGGVWEVLTAVASFNGLLVVTLAITYLVPVLSAVTHKRHLAALIDDLGATPTEILRRAWTGSRFDGLSNHFAQIAPILELYSQRHAAYPILHYFHSASRRTATGPTLAALDEALLLLAVAVHPDVRLAPTKTKPLQIALAGLLRTLQRRYIPKSDKPPPAPDLGPLRDCGIPVVDEDEYRKAVEEHSSRRRLLRALVEHDGWTWDDVRQQGT